MRILDRYLVRLFLSALLYCLFFFFILFVTVDVFNHLDEFLKHSGSFRLIVIYYLYLLPTTLSQIVPVATLVSVLYVLGSLNRHNEIAAMKAGGVSVVQLLSPYLFAALLISFTVFLLNETVVPRFALTSTAIKQGLIQKGKSRLGERAIKNVALYGRENRMIFAREYEVQTRTLYDVVMLQDSPNRVLQSKLTAKKANYDDGRWIFHDAMRYELDRRGDMVGEPVYSESVEMRLPEKPEDFVREASQVDFMSAKELREYILRLKSSSEKLARRLWVDFYAKIAFPFMSVVVMLIGAPLAMRTERGSFMMGIGTSFVLVMLYYGLDSICLALGKGGHLPPFLSAWLGIFLFGSVGIYLIKRSL